MSENLAKNRTSVVHAFLNARYYNGKQGQFLSEDPAFVNLGSRASGKNFNQILTNPQKLNAYAYSHQRICNNGRHYSLDICVRSAYGDKFRRAVGSACEFFIASTELERNGGQS